MNDSQFDTLVSGFYRAATGETDWRQALEPMQVAFGARAVVMHSVDMRSSQMVSLALGGPPMHEQELEYLRKYQLIDPRRERLMADADALLGRWWHCHEHFDQSFVDADPFYQEFLPAVSSRFQSTVVLRCSEHVMAGLALELPAARGVLSADERDCAQRLGLHVQDALRAFERVRAMSAQALAGHGLLSSFPHPMWLLDAERFVHFANPAAQRETDFAGRVVQQGSLLSLLPNRVDRLLTEKLHLLRQAPHGSTAVVDVRQNAADPYVLLHLSVLLPQVVLGAFGDRPLILATLFDPQQLSQLDPFAMATVLGLSPAQARVASQLGEGMTAEQIGLANGTSVATVRTHVRAVLERLGAQRITDVVRMLHQGEALWSKAPT
jgi:DNA-binding CsgD family transcriptional regulator/PAS domain-containing protein